MKVSYKKIAKGLTGIQTPVFGISWNPPDSYREIVKEQIAFFEGQAALYEMYDIEVLAKVDPPIHEIIEHLTESMEKMDPGSDIYPHLQAILAACRKFLASTTEYKGRFLRDEVESSLILGEMRAFIGVHIAQMCVKYGIDVSKELASILPPPLEK